MPLKTLLIVLVTLALVKSSPTFKNVEFKGYSVFTLKFSRAIVEASTLKTELPDQIYDHLEFIEQSIPVLKEGSVSDIEDLDELTIEKCKLKTIEAGAFKNLPMLRRLSLKGNCLEEIAEGVFNNLRISILDLSQNQIKLIRDDALTSLPNLLTINLADNVISEWNKRWFYQVPLLTRISMQNNSLETIPSKAFPNLKGEKRYGKVRLTLNLIFSHNQIKEIEENAFEGIENINNLWLDHNKITNFSDDLLEKVNVKDLRLEHNQIRCLNGNLSSIIKAEMTHMDGNPFDCKCLEKVQKWAEEKDRKLDLFYSEMHCAADRIKKKMSDFEKRLKDINAGKEAEEVNSNQRIEDEIEVFSE
ncbi:chondroadherin-like [Euwallacea fornicatus]|uniref:chondroadherin-like n=1 Tax=Euwallacea fornicatus TaxID=995702 RepID=UPI00338F7854